MVHHCNTIESKQLLFDFSDKAALQKEIETLNSQITSLDSRCDELALARSDLTKDMSSLKADYNDQIRQYARQIDDGTSVKHNLEQVIAHLREEVIDSCTYLRRAQPNDYKSMFSWPFLYQQILICIVDPTVKTEAV